MDLFDIVKKMASGLISEAVSHSNFSQNSGGTSGKTVEQWDNEWICIGPLKTANLTPYNHCLGLYRHVMNGKTRLLSPDNYLDKAY